MQGADEINSVCFNFYLHVLSSQAELKWSKFLLATQKYIKGLFTWK